MAGLWLERISLTALHAGLLLLPLLMRPSSQDVFVGPKYTVMAFLTAISVIAAGAAQALGRPAVLIAAPDWWALAFAIWATVAWLLSVDRGTSLIGEPTQRAGLISMLVVVAVLGAARVVVTSIRRLVGLLITTAIAGSIVALYGLIQILGVDPIWESPAGSRVFSFIGQPNWLGAYLVITIPVTTSLLLATKRTVGRAAISVALVAQFGVLIGALSRAAWIGALAGALLGAGVTLIGSRRVNRLRRAIAMPLIVVLLTAVAAIGLVATSTQFDAERLTTRFGSTLDIDSFEARQRLALWEVALAMAADRPWFGSGPDTYAVLFPNYRDSVIDAYYAEQLAEYRPESSHNAYLDLAAGLGVPGLVILLALLVSAGFRLTRGLEVGAVKGPLLLGILIALISHSVATAFMSIHVTSAWVLWALVGAGLTAVDSSKAPRDDPATSGLV